MRIFLGRIVGIWRIVIEVCDVNSYLEVTEGIIQGVCYSIQYNKGKEMDRRGAVFCGTAVFMPLFLVENSVGVSLEVK